MGCILQKNTFHKEFLLLDYTEKFGQKGMRIINVRKRKLKP